MADKRCFVQFPHPGGEHKPDSSGKTIGWNKINHTHKRKFMQFQASGSKGTTVKNSKTCGHGVSGSRSRNSSVNSIFRKSNRGIPATCGIRTMFRGTATVDATTPTHSFSGSVSSIRTVARHPRTSAV